MTYVTTAALNHAESKACDRGADPPMIHESFSQESIGEADIIVSVPYSSQAVFLVGGASVPVRGAGIFEH